MKKIILCISSVLILAGCSMSGHYQGAGPCEGFHKDQQACQRAYENSLVIGKVQLGQSPTEVRSIMGKDPERRNVVLGLESWAYLTDYANELLTTITFKNGTATEIKQAPSVE